ncbi:aminoglycoside phosphotransferase [Streptomyces sp. NPDC097619]|uniref:aminoglycoside phosphotransferase n=1 Tax=Streptomyces sp. NPDC097619 TaxID=3157228 RepID=UPI003329CF33
MNTTRVSFANLPPAVLAAVAARVGDFTAEDAAYGNGAELSAVLTTPTGTRVFVKGLPEGHDHGDELAAEARIGPHLPDLAPRLLWHLAVGGWTLLGFEGITPEAGWAYFESGSEYLEPVATTLRALSTTLAPPDLEATVWERWGEFCAPGDEALLTGDHLVHGDPASTNFLPDTDGKAWLVDWAWAARGPAWTDTALWGFRLVCDGRQSPEEAAARTSTVPAFARAPREALAVFTEAEARYWEAWRESGATDVERQLTASRAWADHWAHRPD